MAWKHFLTKEDQMEKQAQFTNKKLFFKKSIDFPDLPGVYKFFNSDVDLLSVIIVLLNDS